MVSRQESSAQMFEAISSENPFEQQYESDLRRLGNVDVRNGEGRTLLQHAVIEGRRDWVKALVASGADVSGDSGQTALELAREKLTQHPTDTQRMAIMDVLEAIVAREGHDGGVTSEEIFPTVPDILNLQWLQNILGVKLETCGKRVKLPADELQRLKKTVDQNGNSLLMRASIDGNSECVDFLLRCGAQVNASRTIDNKEQRAIDFAVEKDHKLIVKLLLQWDSLMPHLYEEDPEDWLISMAEVDPDIEDLLQRRDNFHEKVRKGHVDAIKEMVSSGEGKEDSCGNPRYWVNRKGRSALLTALRDAESSVLALLKRLNFDYLENEELQVEHDLTQDRNINLEYKKALVHDVVPITARHVWIMLLQSFMRKGEVEPDGEFRQIYEAADKVHEASVLMQCLQYEEELEVIFDTEKTDISCMYPTTSSGIRGAYDPSLHRVYASAALDPRSDKVSNLVHELAHAVMHVVFENDGLPYLKGDQERRDTYKKIVTNILSQDNIKNCNKIIQRVGECYPENRHPHELIVRVPEIITKLKVEGDYGDVGEPWSNNHERELFYFYRGCVQKDILSWIESRPKANPFAFYSQHVRDVIEVENIETPRRINHNNITYLQVSNLALGVSHVQKSIEGILCVDWAKYLRKRKPLEINLMRRNISHIAVVWDKGMGNKFCEESKKCSEDCPAYEFSSIKEYVTFIVPKSFIIPGGSHPLEYKWGDLSSETKKWILERKVGFQGNDVTLKEMIDNVTEERDMESIMSSIADSDVISWLIDEEKLLTFGSELKSLWGMRGKDFIKNHPEIFFERTMKIRERDLRKAISRGRDAFFFIHAKESDISDINVGEVSHWNSKNVPDGANCFLLEKNVHPLVEKVFCGFICAQIHVSGKWWPYAHFLRVREGMIIHVLSESMSGNVSRLLADEPGCGKTVFAYDAARKEKKSHPEIWTEVVELSKCEEVLERWDENNSEGNGSVEDFLYNLITVGITESQPGNIVRMLFKHFCQAKNMASLYFDGFDEICPGYKNKFSSFLKNLLKDSKVNVLVTSRMNESQHLEEILSTFAIHFVPFDEKKQINYLNKVWNALLQSVEESKRAEKLQSIISNLRARNVSESKYGKVIEDLQRHSEKPNAEVDFSEVAEEVIGMSQFPVKGERYLTGVPLHAWMIAFVYFEDTFHLPQSLELSYFFTRFVTAKLNEYCSGKAALTGRQVGKGVLRSAIDHMRQNLKKFSASFFLRDRKYQPKKEYLSDLVTAGLLFEKSGSFDFTHRTFAELFFSIWMLEEAKHPDVTRILLGSILLDVEFEKVRELINELLLSSDHNKSENDGECICEITQPCIPANEQDEEFSMLFRKSFHKAVYSCHQGIIKYLAKPSKEHLPNEKNALSNALFSLKVCECVKGTRYHLGQKDSHNAFCLKYPYEIKLMDLETIHTLLTLTAENGLIDKLKYLISECGLDWAGVNSKKLWVNEESRGWLLRIIDFFRSHSHILKEAIVDKVFGKNYSLFLKYFHSFAFDEYKIFLNSIGKPCP